MHTIQPANYWNESFRVTCPKMNETHEYCPEADKAAGQGVSFKISRDQELATDHTQFEYALLQNPHDGDTARRLRYDVSLLDCGRISGIKDIEATDEHHRDKLEHCPGYRGGVQVWFSSDSDEKICKRISCDSKTKCLSIYTWEWTRREEASLECESDYHGDVHVELCAGRKPP
jgi:hypothetical protein